MGELPSASGKSANCQSAAEAVNRLTEVLDLLGAPDKDDLEETGLPASDAAIEGHIRAVRRFLKTLS
jgi:hypothetical protein